MTPCHTRPHVGVALCVTKGKQVLLQQRTSKHAEGMWGFPGGHQEMWESFEVTALRELSEEAGTQLHIANVRYACTENTMFFDEGKHYVVIFMKASWIGGEPINMEPDKGGDWVWVDWDKLPQPLMPGIQQLSDKGKLGLLHGDPISEKLDS